MNNLETVSRFHKAEFTLLVMKRYGNDIAGGFTKYDQHAVQQINRNIELYSYKRFGEDLLLLAALATFFRIIYLRIELVEGIAISLAESLKNTIFSRGDISMSLKDKVSQIITAIRSLSKNESVLTDLEWYTFYISLLPIPGVQQASQIAEKMLQDQSLNQKFSEIKQQILSMNDRINNFESIEQRIDAIARIVQAVPSIEEKVNSFIQDIKEHEFGSSFNMETSLYSTQELINQIIDAQLVNISAIDHSQNLIIGSQIKATQTNLRAHNHSHNRVDGTEFKGTDGAVSMNRILQQGDITVSEASVGFGPGSALIFQAPRSVSGNCPICGEVINIAENALVGRTNIQCPKCKTVLPFNVK